MPSGDVAGDHRAAVSSVPVTLRPPSPRLRASTFYLNGPLKEYTCITSFLVNGLHSLERNALSWSEESLLGSWCWWERRNIKLAE